MDGCKEEEEEQVGRQGFKDNGRDSNKVSNLQL